jgi:ankyrin repeat protein
MRAALIALLLSIATQAGAECGKLCYWRWWDSATTADLEAELDAGADVMALDDDGFTPLHWAANRGNSQHIQILVDAGAEVMGRDKRDGTPLHRAACCGGTENIKVLLAAGADIMARAKGGWTPLHSAARGGSLLSIITLLEAGADVNDWARKGGLTPLHMAVYHRRPEVVKAFLEAGAEVMAVQSEFGETPLHIAASCSYLCNSEVILLLMNAGADAKAKDVEGKSPWDLARKNEYLKDTDGYWALNDAQYR